MFIGSGELDGASKSGLEWPLGNGHMDGGEASGGRLLQGWGREWAESSGEQGGGWDHFAGQISVVRGSPGST